MNEHENMIPCACCGELHDPDDLTMTRDGDLVCEDCLSDEYGYCEHCMDYVPFDELDYVNEGTPDAEVWCSRLRRDRPVRLRRGNRRLLVLLFLRRLTPTRQHPPVRLQARTRDRLPGPRGPEHHPHLRCGA